MKQSLHNSPGLWSIRDLRLVLPARAVSFFGDSLALVLLTLEIARTDRPMVMTVLLIAFSLPLFALASVAGRLVDEHDSRTLLVMAGGVQVIASLGLVWGPNLIAIIGFVLLLQAGQSVTAPTWGAVVPRIVGDELVGKAVGLQQSLSSLAGLGGAAAAGLLYAAIGYHAAMLVDTTTFALLVLVGAMVRTRRGRRYDAAQLATRDAESESTEDDAARSMSGQTFISRDGLLRLLVPALYLVVLALEAPNVVEVFLITDDLGASAAVYGLVTAAFMLGNISGPLLATRISTELARLTWAAVSAVLLGVLVIGIGLSPDVWVVLGLFTVCGIAGGALNALIGTLVITRTPEQLRGRVLARLGGTARGFSVLAMVLGGLGGQFLGARPTFVICGALGVLAGMVVLRARRGLLTPASAPAGESAAPALAPA
jgi:MFS family permease